MFFNRDPSKANSLTSQGEIPLLVPYIDLDCHISKTNQTNRSTIIKLLIDHGADVNAKSMHHGRTAIQCTMVMQCVSK